MIKMHKIDPSNPSRQFYFSILVVNDKYTGKKQVCLAQASAYSEMHACGNGKASVT